VGKLLLLDDDRDVIKAVLQVVPELDHEIFVSSNYLEGIAYWKSNTFDIIILQLPPEYAINLFPFYAIEKDKIIKNRIKKIFNYPIKYAKFWTNMIHVMNLTEKIILITKGGNWNTSKLIKQYGIFDHIQKPYLNIDDSYKDFDYEVFKERLAASILRAFEVFKGIDFAEIIGRDFNLRKAMNSLADASRTNFNVLITGENGTGKKLFARKIHDNSRFKNGPFILIDCHSIEKLDTNLFALKGGQNNSPTNNPGTILFHNIDLIPTAVQIDLYNYLHNSINLSIQDSQLAQSKPRIIASTSKRKEELIEKGLFLEDLYNEIGFLQIFLPPLRERTNDIPVLADYFVNTQHNKNTENSCHKISKDLYSHFAAYNWPGNITEFINVINQVISNASGVTLLSPVHLPEKIFNSTSNNAHRRTKSYIEKLLSEALKFYEKKNEKPSILKLEDYPWMDSDENYPWISKDKRSPTKTHYENIQTESRHKIKAIKHTEYSENSTTIKFYQSGDYWIIGAMGSEATFKDLKGFHFISFLLQYPNIQLTAIDVFNTGKRPAGFVTKETAFQEGFKPYDDILRPIKKDRGLSLEKILDEIERLKEKIESGDYDNPEEYVNIKQNIDYLENLIKHNPNKKERSIVLKKTIRDHKSESELSRVNVTKRIYAALNKILSINPKLGLYLNKSTIKTGDSFSYSPVVGKEPIWILHKGPASK
jgi:DNA-binding NtrC family response regulator